MRKTLAVAAGCLLAAGFLSAQSVTVVKPAAGETVTAGSGYTIVWTKSGTLAATVRISLRNAQTLAETALIAAGAPNSGSFGWQMPGNVPPGSYRVRVSVLTMQVKDDSDPFTIAPAPSGPVVVHVPPLHPRPPFPVGRPALSISGAAVVCNADTFAVTFAYKNSGVGPLPKASAMPVKPDFRVVVDGQEVQRGFLFIPAFEAPPGWEVPSFFAFEVKVAGEHEYDFATWTLGRQMTVEINTNQVNGMAADRKTFDVRELGLGCSYDAQITHADYDWATEVLTTTVRIDGQTGILRKLRLAATRTDSAFIDTQTGGFIQDYDLVPGQKFHTLTRKVHLPDAARLSQLDLWFLSAPVKADGRLDLRDVHHPNNRAHYTFHR